MRAQGQSWQCLAVVGMEGGREWEFLKRSQGMELGPCQLMLTSATALQTGPAKPIWLLYRLFDLSSWEDLVLVAYVVECGICLTLQWTTFKVRLISRYPWLLLPQHEHAHTCQRLCQQLPDALAACVLNNVTGFTPSGTRWLLYKRWPLWVDD